MAEFFDLRDARRVASLRSFDLSFGANDVAFGSIQYLERDKVSVFAARS